MNATHNTQPNAQPNPALTDTPRTDAKCNDYSGVLMFTGGAQYIPADFARTLEREITSLRAALAGALAVAACCGVDHWPTVTQARALLARINGDT